MSAVFQHGGDGKIAILVLAYRAPLVLAKCLSLFDSGSFHFFVHVDPKAVDADFFFLTEYANVTVIPERFNIFWGGFNMVRAELALLRTAICNNQIRSFVLISDDSFPLHSADHIRAALGKHVNWIDQHKVSDGRFLKRYVEYYYLDSFSTDAQFRLPEQRSIGLEQVQDIRDLQLLLQRGKKQLTQLYQGSQWWCLSREASEYVLLAAEGDAHMRESFRFSMVPDEHYIQTIIGNSGIAWLIRPTHMYFDFSQDPKPFVYSAIEQLERPLSSERLFVRKVAGDRAFLDALAKRLAI